MARGRGTDGEREREGGMKEEKDGGREEREREREDFLVDQG